MKKVTTVNRSWAMDLIAVCGVTLALAGCVSSGDRDSEEASEPVEDEASALSADALAPPCGAVMSSIDGVNAYSNGPDQGTSFSCGGLGFYGFRWQCTELAQRYFTRCFGAGYWLVLFAYQMCDQPVLGTTVYPANGSYTPVHGDLMVIDHSATSTTGHVAVIDSVSGSAASVVEENASVTGRRSRSLSSARCFIHANKNDGHKAPSCGGIFSLRDPGDDAAPVRTSR